MKEAGERRRVLIIDNEPDIAEIARAVLHDEGYDVALVYDLSPDVIAAAVTRHEPDAVLLDGASDDWGGYGDSWDVAARLARRPRPVPVIMFTAHSSDAAEALARESERSRTALFAGVVAKPFDVEDLLSAVARATGGPGKR